MSSRRFAGLLVPFVLSFAALAQAQDTGGDPIPAPPPPDRPAPPDDDVPPPPDADGGVAMMPPGLCFGVQPAECPPDALGAPCGDNGACVDGLCVTLSGVCG